MSQRKKLGPPEGHPRWGGRKKRTAQMARDLAEKLNCDPLEFMMRVMTSDTIEQTEIQPDGTEKRVKVAIPLDVRMDAAKTVSQYLYPKLSTTQVTGADDGPVRVGVTELDITQLLKDPVAAQAATELALKLAAQQQGELAPPAPWLIPD